MSLAHIPLLQQQRDLYDLPRGWARFECYLELMTGGGQEMVLPLSVLNPMGKVHVAETLNRVLELNAEGVAAEAVEEAVERLAHVPELRHGLVVADDTQGGWTDRYLTDWTHRFNTRAEASRGWTVTLFWTSEQVTRPKISEKVLAQVYRTLYQQRTGLPKSLAAHLRQEGLALTFAGVEQWLDADDIAYSLEVMTPYAGTTETPTVFACLYGDKAATSVGYPVLGLSERAGFAVGLEEVRQEKISPEEVLDTDSD